MSSKSYEKASCINQHPYFSNCLVLLFFIGLGSLVGAIVLLITSIPPETKFNIVEASIKQFDLTSNNTLYYNFKVTVTATNFDTRIESYDEVIAIVSYKDNQLASVKMAPFVLNGKNIVRLQPMVFEGNNVMIFNPQQLVKYNKETQLGIYNLDLNIDLNFFSSYYIHCPNLRVPLISKDKVAPTFNVTTCSHERY
jgi:hypothetical protein